MTKDTALILIDLQNDYFKGGKCELYEPEIAVNNAKNILDFFRKKSSLIIHIQHLNTNMQKEAPYFIPETKGVEIHNLVKPIGNEIVVVKHTPNSFLETNLNDILINNKIKNLVICGMMSHMCIDTTVRAAKCLGYNISLIDDACACPNLSWKNNLISATNVHNVIMASLNGAFASIYSTNDWINKNNN